MDILTQDEADTLGVIEKYLIEPESVLIPPIMGPLSRPLKKYLSVS